ncbi:hypothetical protein AAY473_008886 [Plecturocebus cupreus]
MWGYQDGGDGKTPHKSLCPNHSFPTNQMARQSLSLLPRQECSGMISVHRNLCLLDSRDSPASASRVAGISGMHHYAQLIYYTRFHHVGQAGLELLISSVPPNSASPSAGITGMGHCVQPRLPNLPEPKFPHLESLQNVGLQTRHRPIKRILQRDQARWLTPEAKAGGSEGQEIETILANMLKAASTRWTSGGSPKLVSGFGCPRSRVLAELHYHPQPSLRFTIELLNALDVILGQAEVLGVGVNGSHQGSRVLGVLQPHGVAKLVGCHEEQAVP